jgi:hypothetical protein
MFKLLHACIHIHIDITIDQVLEDEWSKIDNYKRKKVERVILQNDEKERLRKVRMLSLLLIS